MRSSIDPAIWISRVATWLDAKLPVICGEVHIDRNREIAARVLDDTIVVALYAAQIVDGQIAEVVEQELPIATLDDVNDEERTRAFFEGWSIAAPLLASKIGGGANDLTQIAPPIELLEDLDLASADDFADAISRARWMDSRPDVSAYPDLLAIETAIARDPELEKKIDAAPTLEHFQALGESLARAGDPRGALIELQIDSSRAAARRASQHLRHHRKYFFGNFPGADPYGFDSYADEIQLTWRWGFVVEAVLDLSLDTNGPSPEMILRALFALPSARFLEALTLGISANENDAEDLHAFHGWTPLLLGIDRTLHLRVLEIRKWKNESEDAAKLRARFPKARVEIA